MKKHNEGFTLVELLCAIVAGSIVTAATATILLLGLRMNAKANEIATRDNQIQIGLSVMRDLAKENKIKVEFAAGENVSDEENTDSWSVKNAADDTVTFYSFENQAIQVNGAPLIDNVQYASIDGPDEDNGLLKIVLTIDGEKYPLSVRCRTGQIFTMPTEPSTTDSSTP